jgi:hypothetical protein
VVAYVFVERSGEDVMNWDAVPSPHSPKCRVLVGDRFSADTVCRPLLRVTHRPFQRPARDASSPPDRGARQDQNAHRGCTSHHDRRRRQYAVAQVCDDRVGRVQGFSNSCHRRMHFVIIGRLLRPIFDRGASSAELPPSNSAPPSS